MNTIGNAAPRLVGFTPWVGQPSNVWMYRQFKQLDNQLQTIITWEYLNRDQFPLPNTDVRIVPAQFAEPLHGWPRTMDTFLSPRIGGERFGQAFNRWMQKQLVDCRAEAVIGQFGHYAMVAEVAARPLGIPTFCHFHGFDISARLNKKRYLQSIQQQWHPFAGIIVVARYQRDLLIEQGIDPESIALIPCGAPTKEIAATIRQIRAGAPRQDNEIRFLFVGRFTEKKDPLSVLKAFQLCHAQNPAARLRMAGFGPLEDQCRQWIGEQEQAFATAIEFLGTLTPAQVIQELANSDVFVQHSRTAANGDKEGWPVVIGEAMAAGLPIVATRHAGIVDQVAEAHNGLLCNEGDWRQMGADMAALAAQRNLRDRMSEASLQVALQHDAADKIEHLRDFVNQRVEVFRAKRRAA
jgi:colanic acid/amylovoran biosynthesis glycosyltransferase